MNEWYNGWFNVSGERQTKEKKVPKIIPRFPIWVNGLLGYAIY